jgi:16S rRNA G966 N2-methylase RsmD
MPPSYFGDDAVIPTGGFKPHPILHKGKEHDNRTPEQIWKDQTGWLLKYLGSHTAELIDRFMRDQMADARKHGTSENDVTATIDMMMTPYPLSRVFVVRMYQILQSMGMLDYNDPLSTVSFMDPMGGTGADAFAVMSLLHPQVVITAGDIDPVKAKFMEHLLNQYSKGESEVDQAQRSTVHAANVHTSNVETMQMPNIDILYLDPPWPRDSNQHYMIGTTTLPAFVEKKFQEIPTLRMVVCKVSATYTLGPSYPAFMDMCKKHNMRMEEFWPVASTKTQRDENGKPTKGGRMKRVEAVKVHYAPEGMPEVSGWNNAWDEKISGIPGYPGTVRFIIIIRLMNHAGKSTNMATRKIQMGGGTIQRLWPRPNPTKVASAALPLMEIDQTGTSLSTHLDVSCFL